MKLTVWTYEGPPHVGAMRVATGMRDLHLVLHAPQGDTYADLLFTMIERRGQRPPVSYTTFQARDLGSDTASLFRGSAQAAYDRFQPQALMVAASCTAELIQDDPGGLAETLGLPVPVIALDLPSYQRKENFGCDEAFVQIARALAKPVARTERVSCNILGPTGLGFRHRDDVVEISALLRDMGIEINAIAPMGSSPADIARLGAAHFNVLLYPETGESAARWLEREFRQPWTKTIPIGARATRAFIDEVRALSGSTAPVDDSRLRQPWWAASVDSTYLTGKRVFVFGDGTHAMAAAKVARDEMGFDVCGLGCYNREMARPLRTLARDFGLEALITDDYLEVEAAIEALQPELILGTQMERHIGKRLGIPCAVISAPVHVQDFPARHSPQMGFEGANVLFDTWVHPLVMGLEEHLLTMFREDFEFHDAAGPSHHGGHAPKAIAPTPIPQTPPAEAARIPAAPLPEAPRGPAAPSAHAVSLASVAPGPVPAGASGAAVAPPSASADTPRWHPDAERELRKIPFFVRGKARRNTETFATDRGLSVIALETLYDAKAHYAR